MICFLHLCFPLRSCNGEGDSLRASRVCNRARPERLNRTSEGILKKFGRTLNRLNSTRRSWRFSLASSLNAVKVAVASVRFKTAKTSANGREKFAGFRE